jgi:hypothetical protein
MIKTGAIGGTGHTRADIVREQVLIACDQPLSFIQNDIAIKDKVFQKGGMNIHYLEKMLDNS